MTSKYYRVSKINRKCGDYESYWSYSIKKNKKQILLRYVNLEDLKNNVLYLNLPWGLKKDKEKLQINDVDFEKAYRKYKMGLRPYSKLSRFRYKNKSGIKRVRERQRKNGEIYYSYRIRIDGVEKTFSAQTIEELKDKVDSLNLPWETV